MVEREEEYLYQSSLDKACPAVIMSFLKGWAFFGRKDYRPSRHKWSRMWRFQSPVFETQPGGEHSNMSFNLMPDDGKLELDLVVNNEDRFGVENLAVNAIYLRDSRVAICNECPTETVPGNEKRMEINFNPQKPVSVFFKTGAPNNAGRLYVLPLGVSVKKVTPVQGESPNK